MQSLCTLRDHCRQRSRNTRYRAGAAPYSRRSSTGWIAPACLAHVAVGTRISSRAPRTDPYVRLSRIRLPPRVGDGKAVARPRVEDDRFWEPGVRQPRHPCPGDPILVAATPQRAPPKVSDMVPEHVQCARVGRHGVVVEVAADNPCQPLPLLGYRLVHAPSQRLLDLPQLRPHAVPSGLSLQLKSARAGLPADEGVSRLAGFHRQPLVEPCVNFSAHTAPIRQTYRSCRSASERRGSSYPVQVVAENDWRGFCVP